MTETKDSNLKLQEWVVRFDGEVKHSEKFIDKEEYYKKCFDNSSSQG